jgi:hypothetical protein
MNELSVDSEIKMANLRVPIAITKLIKIQQQHSNNNGKKFLVCKKVTFVLHSFKFALLNTGKILESINLST